MNCCKGGIPLFSGPARQPMALLQPCTSCAVLTALGLVPEQRLLIQVQVPHLLLLSGWSQAAALPWPAQRNTESCCLFLSTLQWTQCNIQTPAGTVWSGEALGLGMLAEMHSSLHGQSWAAEEPALHLALAWGLWDEFTQEQQPPGHPTSAPWTQHGSLARLCHKHRATSVRKWAQSCQNTSHEEQASANC